MEIYKCSQCKKIVRVIQVGNGELFCCTQKMELLSYFENYKAVIEFAIEKEQEAQNFYLQWAKKINNENVAGAFKDFAVEESRHREKLEKLKADYQTLSNFQSSENLKISDFLDDAEISENIDYQDALLIALKREKLSFKLYSKLASVAKSEELITFFKNLAQEEQNHKSRLESEYEKIFLKEN